MYIYIYIYIYVTLTPLPMPKTARRLTPRRKRAQQEVRRTFSGGGLGTANFQTENL